MEIVRKTAIYILLFMAPAVLWAQHYNRYGGYNGYNRYNGGYSSSLYNHSRTNDNLSDVTGSEDLYSNNNYRSGMDADFMRYAKNYYKDADKFKITIFRQDTGASIDFLEFFFDETDTNKVFYKSITRTEYHSDSLGHVGYLLSKTVKTFNRAGEELTGEVTVDDKVTSRVAYTYDSKNRLVDNVSYRTEYGKGLRKEDESHREYDAKGKLVKMESSGDGSKSVVYYKYNSAGYLYQILDCNKEGLLDKTDTTIWNYMYDNKNRIMMSEKRNGPYKNLTYDSLGKEKYVTIYYFDRNYYAYDINGRIILDAHAYNGYSSDSTSTVRSYDDNGWVLSENYYRDETLVTTYTRKPTLDGHFTETYEQLSTAAPNTCPNNVVLVLEVDSNDHKMVKTETRYVDGKPVVSTTNYATLYNAEGRMIYDTAIMVSKGHLYSMKSQEVVTYTRNAHGYVTEMSDESGGDYNSNWKYTCQYDDKDELIDYAIYNACDEFIPEREYKYSYYGTRDFVKQKISTQMYSETVTDYGPDMNVVRIFEKPRNVEARTEYRRRNYYDYEREQQNESSGDGYTVTLYTYETWDK